MTDRVIRPSSLTTFADCARRWAAQHLRLEIVDAGYDLRHATATHIGAHVGTGVHETANVTLATKAAQGTLGNEADVIEQGLVRMRERISQEGAQWDEATDSLNTAEKQLRRMAKVYRRDVAPHINPVLVEERLEAEIADGFILSGQMDAVAGDPHNVLRDLKTGTRQRANALQYGAYALLLDAHGYSPVAIYEDYIKRVPIKHEQPPAAAKPIEKATAAAHAIECIEDLTKATNEFDRRIADANGRAPEMAFRANPASSLCSDRFCPAWGTRWCRAHA